MEPVNGRIIRRVLPGTVKVFIQKVYFVLYFIPPGNVIRWLGHKIAVLKGNDLFRMIHNSFIIDKRIPLFFSLQNGLDTTPIPVEPFLFDHVL